MQFITADTASVNSIEQALNAAFASVFGMDDAPDVQRHKKELSPLMWKIVEAMPVGAFIKTEDIGKAISVSVHSVRRALETQRGRLIDHGFVLVSARSKGLMLKRVSV